MSGICGIINFDGAPVTEEVLEAMATVAAHRGPDGVHYWRQDGVGVAHLALRVTPESLHERQPLVKEGLLVVAHARIDNRDELLPLLRAKGYVSSNPSDAEVICAAYRHWGKDCAEKLVGDFAFAIWDERERQLFAARDPMAMRPFYYRLEAKRFIFGSEVKQILKVPGVEKDIFEPAVAAYIAGYGDRLDWTFYGGVKQLMPGHALVVSEGRERSWRYWDINPDERIHYRREEAYAEHFLELFKEAVRCRMRSIKPVGIFLSGGMDSGSIASTAAWLLQREGGLAPGIHAYAFAFKELTWCDERHISDVIVRHYNLAHTPVWAEEAYPLKDYPAHSPDQDEPFIGHYHTLYEHTLATARAEGMGVMLSGDSGDSMVGGGFYDHLGLLLSGRWRTLWSELWAHSQILERSLLGTAWQTLGSLPALLPPERGRWLRRSVYLAQRLMRRPKRTAHHSPWLNPELEARVGLKAIMSENLFHPQRSKLYRSVGDYSRESRYHFIYHVLDLHSMPWMERARARAALAFADPWSDRRIASFVLAVPQWALQVPSEPKRIARHAMREIMPAEVRKVSSKIFHGDLFDNGIRDWAKDTVQDLLTDMQADARGYLDEKVLRRHYELFQQDKQGHFGLWEALTLEMWLRQHWST